MRILYLLLAALFYSTHAHADDLETIAVNFEHKNKVYHYTSTKFPFGYYFNSSALHHVSMATLDWPPYIGEGLCDRGWVFQLGVALLLSRGYGVKVSFFPWARAVKEVENGNVDILFPEYYIEPDAPSDIHKGKKRLDNLALSRPFPGGEIAFLQRAGEVINFRGDLKSLVGETIGVVRGYQNTPEFDRMMDAGHFTIMHAVNDLQLAKLLFAKRVNLIIGDPRVLNHTVRHSDLPNTKIRAMLDVMQQVTPALEYKYLYFAISKHREHWQSLIERLNLALVEFNRSGELKRIVEEKNGSCMP